MKGLLLKDYYVILKTCRLQLGIIVLMLALSLVRGLAVTYLGYAMLFAGMLAVYALSVDEKGGWNAYAQALPYTRRELVTAKYLVALIAVGLSGALALLLWAGAGAVTGKMPAGGLSSLAFGLALGLFFPAVTLPFMFRFGTEKGRIYMLAVVALMVGAILVSMAVASDEGDAGLPAAAAAMGPLAPAVLIAAAVLFALSWLLAVRLFEKREF